MPSLINAQIGITAADELPFTPNNIVENVLLGPGVEVNNILFEGTSNSIGVFNNGASVIGLDYGIVLSTGFAKTIEEANDETTNAKGETSDDALEDSHLQDLASGVLKDICRYEITFTPESDTIRFRYVFASEEYPEFVCSNFNDVFGFFITGPNPNGGSYNQENIARVPDPSDPSGTTFLNNNVSINSVNIGMQGNLGTIDPANCAGDEGSLAFSQYYNEVDDGEYPVFDAYLDVFIAQAAVMPCEEYTIKLAIADVQDQDFDSAVFLEAGSFASSALSINLNTFSNDGSIAEGCSEAQIELSIPSARSTDTNIQLSSFPPGSFSDQAEEGVDYLPLPANVTIPASSTFTEVMIEAVEDNIQEGDEYIYLDFRRSVCKRDTIKIKIHDNRLTDVMLPGDTSLCANDILIVAPTYDPPIVQFEGQVFTNTTDVVLEESNGSYSSIIQVQGVAADNLGQGVLTKVCVDELVTRNMTDIELFLIAPQGQILELSTNNGEYDKPPMCQLNPNEPACIDSLLNTCFTAFIGDNINNGNSLLGPIFNGNENYTGDFRTEGDWSKLYVDDASANGDWELVVKTDSVTTLDLSNANSYLGSWSMHFGSQYEVNHIWSPNFDIFCTECDTTFFSPDLDVTYKINATDSYGCTSNAEIRINSLPVPETPQIIPVCNDLSPSSIEITWNDQGAGVENYNISLSEDPPYLQTEETSFIFEGLQAGTDHTFYVSAYNGVCNSNLDSIQCTTPPCSDGPIFDFINPYAPSCSGRNDGGILSSATAENGGEVTYFLNGQENNTGEFDFLLAGEYTLSAVDNEGCSTVETVIVPVAESIPFSQTGAPISCVGFSDASAVINILETDNGPYTILWQNLSEEFVLEDLSMGTYFFTITDGSGCNYEENIVISDPEPLEFAIVEAQLPPCFGDEGTIDITMSGGQPGYDFTWEDSSENTSLIDFFPGVYNVTVTDANNCTVTNSIEIEERLEINLLPDTLQAACIGELSQEIELDIFGGQAPFEVDWNTSISGTEVIDVPVGFYELTITDDNNCVRIDSVEITNHPDVEFLFDLREPECFNIYDGIISLNSASFTDGSMVDGNIIWEDGSTEEAIGLLQGDSLYQFVYTDDFGCKHEDAIYLSSPPTIFIDVDTINLLDCFGDADGSFGITSSGGDGILTTEWPTNIPDLEDDVASGLGVGIYTITVTDEEECSLEFDFLMLQPDELIFNTEVKDVKCFGESTGQINGNLVGGVMPYDIQWSNGTTSDTLSGISSGSYEVSIVDANGCDIEESYEVDEPTESLYVEIEAFATECFGEDNGSIEIDASGGTMPYNFLLNGVNYFDNPLIGGLGTGLYDLLVIDANGCEFSVDDIFVGEANEVFINLPEDTIVDFGASLALEFMTNATNLVDYFWECSSPEIILSCYDCPNPIIASVITDCFVTLTVRDEFGCKYTTNQYRITENDDSFIEVPTGFSPNGDNRNDRLFIFGKENVTVLNFDIFDRWGEHILSIDETVLTETRQLPVWDGTFNGEEMDSGVYVWKSRIEKPNGEIVYLEGSVTLLR